MERKVTWETYDAEQLEKLEKEEAKSKLDDN